MNAYRWRKPVLQGGPREDIEEADPDRQEWSAEEQEAEAQEKALPQPLDPESCASDPLSPPLPKRRRLGPLQPLVPDPDPDPITISSSDPQPSSPPPSPAPFTRPLILTPPRPAPPPPNQPRFLIPGPSPSSPPPPLPKFLLPTPPPPPPALPTPFSPPGPSQKYLPNGLASTVRDLVVETALQASHLARLRGKADAKQPKAEESWDFRVQVTDARRGDIGEGIVLVRGSDGTGWALLGKAKGSGSEETDDEMKAMVRTGCEVRVRKPVWEVELLGERWVVGVEWEFGKYVDRGVRGEGGVEFS